MFFLRVARTLLPAIFVVATPLMAYSEEFPLKEYESHVKRYLSSLENLSVEFTTTGYVLDGSATFSEETSLISMPGYFRVKTVDSVKYKNGKKTAKINWLLLRPDGYYEITERGEGQFVLKGMRKEINSPLLVDAGTPLSELTEPIRASRHPINRLIRGDLKETHTFEPRNFQRHGEKGADAFTFQASAVINGGHVEDDIALNDRWLVTRFNLKVTGERGQRKTTIIYTMLGERLLPKRITSELTDKTGKSLGPSFGTEFSNYRDYNGNLADFSLVQFGMPETSAAFRGSTWYLWFIGIGAVSIGVGGYFWRRAQRRASA